MKSIIVCFCFTIFTIMSYSQTTNKTMNTIEWTKLPDLPGTDVVASLGVSAPFSGVHAGKLLVAGGCNFPNKPAAEGGSKRYYNDIFMLDLETPASKWEKAGHLSQPVAYGITVTTPWGIVCIGGNNEKGSLKDVVCITWDETAKKTVFCKLPDLPNEMDNLSGTYIDSTIYIAGGNENGYPSNSFLKLDMKEAIKGNGKWEILPSFPGHKRVQAVLVAQQSPNGICIYLAGGFQAGDSINETKLPVDILSYNLKQKEWKKETTIPFHNDGTLQTFTGGSGIAYGNNKILFMGGVNYNRFLRALERPRLIALAKVHGEEALVEQLAEEGRSYLHHPIEWYQFNKSLLVYNTSTKEWETLGEYEQLARAGAGAVLYKNDLIIVNGELKPGIRTPQVNRVKLLK